MKQLLYVANARVPSRKAHVYQILQMCDAFVQAGNDVELVVPMRRRPENAPASVNEYYDAPLDFKITRLPCIDFLWLVPHLPGFFGAPLFYLQVASFSVVATLYALVASADVIYSRARFFTVIASPLVGDRLVVEIHRRPSRDWVTWIVGSALNRVRGVVVITESLRAEWHEVTTAPIVVEPDGVRLERFEPTEEVETLRADLGIPIDRQIVCYTGSLQEWKGVETLIQAASQLPDNVLVYVVGGSDEERQSLRERVEQVPDNVFLVGHVPPGIVPEYLAVSDVLALPNSADRDISARYTSPLKLFEYMAAERPIVASDLPSLREILDEETAYFARPDDAGELAAAIERALDGDDERRAATARERVEQYTWNARAERIDARFFGSDRTEVTGTCTS